METKIPNALTKSLVCSAELNRKCAIRLLACVAKVLRVCGAPEERFTSVCGNTDELRSFRRIIDKESPGYHEFISESWREKIFN